MYTITFHNDYVEIEVTGTAVIDIFMAFAREMLSSPKFRSGMGVLADLTRAEGFSFDNFKYADIERFAGLISRNRKSLEGSKMATVTSNDADAKAVVSLYDSILEFHGLKLDRRMFSDRLEALAWLQE